MLEGTSVVLPAPCCCLGHHRLPSGGQGGPIYGVGATALILKHYFIFNCVCMCEHILHTWRGYPQRAEMSDPLELEL